MQLNDDEDADDDEHLDEDFWTEAEPAAFEDGAVEVAALRGSTTIPAGGVAA